MTYQGYLTDASGNALGSANTGPKNYDVVFRIWDSQTAGNELYAEQQTVTVAGGYFSVLLGEGSAYQSEPQPPISSLFTNGTASQRYVEITVQGIGAGTPPANVTIMPRLRLLSSPYSFLAGYAVTAAGLANGGNAVVSINNSNYVGINQQNPASMLDVNGIITALGLNVNGTNTAAAFIGNGSGLTNLNAAALTGSVPGATLTSVPAAALTGSVPSATLTSVPAAALTGSVPSATLTSVSAAALTGSVPSATLTSVPGAALTGTVADANLSTNIAKLNMGQTFTGTNSFSMPVKLTGANPTLYASGGEESLRIVRGSVSSAGTIAFGSGFTVTWNTSAVCYVITFNTPFSAVPSVVGAFAGPVNQDTLCVYNITTNGCSVACVNNNGNWYQWPFSFIAVGPR
jgi:hypothetical protein